MSVPDRRREQLREKAAELIVQAHLKGVTPEHDAVLATWRRTGKAHEAAYAETSGAWDGIEGLDAHPLYAELMGEPTWRERWVSWRDELAAQAEALLRPQRLAFATLLLAMIVTAGWWTQRGTSQSEYRTQIAEVRQIPLEDGSQVTLGARSALDVAFTKATRRVKLGEGEAFFSVAHNPARPFLVEAGDTLIRVVGTKFNVNYEQGRVRVTVLEGVVQVIRAGGQIERISAPDPRLPMVTLRAGQQALDTSALTNPKVEPEPSTEAGSWRDGRLSYQEAPLAEVVADANRYRSGEIRIASATLGQERLTTSFKTSQIDQMLDQLPETLPLRVERNNDGSVDLKPK